MKTRKKVLCFTLLCFCSLGFTSFTQKHNTPPTHTLTKRFAPSVSVGIGPGPYEYSVSITNADPSAVSVDVYIDFNGDPTNTLVNVPLSGGTGFTSGQMPFITAQGDFNGIYQYHY